MSARTYSATLQGVEGQIVQVEAALQLALPKIHITGLPGDIVKESKERVQGCLGNLGFNIPSGRIVVHLSPATAKKQGSQFDVAIALAVLSAEGILRDDQISKTGFIGELTLGGEIRPVPAAFNLIEALVGKKEIERILVPEGLAKELSLLKSPKLRSVGNLAEAIDFLRGNRELSSDPVASVNEESVTTPRLTLDDVIGQAQAKRALQISMAGGHHLLFVGSPGIGKSLLASLATTLLPKTTREEWIRIVKNFGHHSHELPPFRERPFRSPHHTVSTSAILGGGSGSVVAGEVTLAHHGVLFLDEFPEFRKDVIEGLREPLQNGTIQIHRVGHSLSLPAAFTLLAAMNPCPCGYSMDVMRRCICSIDKIHKYQRKVSGPILDRIDLTVVMESRGEVYCKGLSHREMERSIRAAWTLQANRFLGDTRNGAAPMGKDDPNFEMTADAKAWFNDHLQKRELSYRSLFKIVRVARTIADLAQQIRIEIPHLEEAKEFKCTSFGNSLFPSSMKR